MTDMMKNLHRALKFCGIDFNNNKKSENEKSETNATMLLQCNVQSLRGIV